jgi:predicted RNase H-like nuclease (RuvC/YqgF family)
MAARRKSVSELRADVSRLTRENQRLFDELGEANVDREKFRVIADDLAKKLQVTADDLATKLNQKGEELGRAHARIERLRQIADTALYGLSTLAASTNDPALVSTALALVRDGRAQLANGHNGHGGSR